MIPWHTDIPLADKNWFRTGGKARFFYQPRTAAEFQEALIKAHTMNIPVFILGKGANLLISDDGFNGLIINPQLTEIELFTHTNTQKLVRAGAGVSIDDLIAFCLDHNLLGLEEFSGIPGSVGGATYINLHYFEFLLSNFLISGEIIDYKNGEIKSVTHEWFNFGYNTSTLLQEEYYLVSATFLLKSADAIQTAYARGRRAEIIRHRQRRYPISHTCGSFFRNFKPEEIGPNQLIYVAYYLDKIGIKGILQQGDAIVSYQHANMLVNKGNATSDDIITVARTMQSLVRKEFGITPQPECRLIGFKHYPLLA